MSMSNETVENLIIGEFVNSFHQEKEDVIIKNLGSGTQLTVKEFAEYWWNEWSAEGELKFGAIPYRKNEVMRFIPKIDVEDPYGE